MSLDPQRSGDQDLCIFSIGDLMARGLPSHEICDLQLSSIEEKIGDAFRKDTSDALIASMLAAFLAVPDLNPDMREQLTDCDILIRCEEMKPQAVSELLVRCRARQHGLYKQIRFQQKGIKARRKAGTLLGAEVGVHLSVQKTDQLQQLVDTVPAEFDRVDDWIRIYQLWVDIDVQTRGNVSFRAAHHKLIDTLQARFTSIVNAFKQHVTSVLEPVLVSLHSDTTIYASLEGATNALRTTEQHIEISLAKLRSMVGPELIGTTDSFTNKFKSYLALHIALNAHRNESGQKNGASLAVVAAALHGASCCDPMTSVELVPVADRLFSFTRTMVTEDATSLLRSVCDRLRPLYKQIFKGELLQLTPTHIRNVTVDHVIADSSPLRHGVPTDITDIAAFADEVRAVSADIIQVATIHTLGIKDLDVLAIFHTCNISGTLPGAALLLPSVIRCVLSIAKIAPTPLPTFPNDPERVTKANFMTEVRSYIAAVHAYCSAIGSVNHDTLATAVAATNAHHDLGEKSSLARIATLTIHVDEITTHTFRNLAEIAPAVDDWVSGRTQRLRIGFDTFVAETLTNAKASMTSMDNFEASFPGPDYDQSAIHDFVCCNPSMKLHSE